MGYKQSCTETYVHLSYWTQHSVVSLSGTKLHMQICTSVSIYACMNACEHVLTCKHACFVVCCVGTCMISECISKCDCASVCVFVKHCAAISSSLSIRHSVSWTPSQTGRRRESDLTPDCAFGEEGLEACQLSSGSTSPLCPSYFFPSARPKL